MIAEYPKRIALRISVEEQQKIDQLIQEGKFKSLSQAIRSTIKDFLKREINT
jgi:Arc/MetJ-type ribon-helix-helix transcriptional regulator